MARPVSRPEAEPATQLEPADSEEREHDVDRPPAPPGEVEMVEPVALAPLRAVPSEVVALDGQLGVRSPMHSGIGARAPVHRTMAPPARGTLRAFAQGAILGTLLLVPALAVVVQLLGVMQSGADLTSFALTLARTAVYAGLPAALLVGAVARSAARVAARRDRAARRHALGSAVLGTSAVGAGLGALTAASLHSSWQHPGWWLWLIAAGGVIGAAVGYAAGRLVTSARRGA